ncbi:hypothetical protein [Ferrovum sp.]|jgi:hypothetical protein|uniref:hypothetical protein n=1 Tax=Ferrovum sp. TaxID=2609467 RepID=UPI00262A6B5B|nr:hypothetical protein [Ferrovum sp.]
MPNFDDFLKTIEPLEKAQAAYLNGGLIGSWEKCLTNSLRELAKGFGVSLIEPITIDSSYRDITLVSKEPFGVEFELLAAGYNPKNPKTDAAPGKHLYPLVFWFRMDYFDVARMVFGHAKNISSPR